MSINIPVAKLSEAEVRFIVLHELAHLEFHILYGPPWNGIRPVAKETSDE